MLTAIKEKLDGIVSTVQRKHGAAIDRLAKEGKHIGLERVFRREVESRYGVKIFAFTDRERGNLSHLVTDLGTDEVGAFLIEATIKWKEFLTEEYLKHLPPTPVFNDLFYNRQRIQACLVSLNKKEEKRNEFLDQLKPETHPISEPEPEGGRKSNLMELFKKELGAVRQQKQQKIER